MVWAIMNALITLALMSFTPKRTGRADSSPRLKPTNWSIFRLRGH